MSYERTGRNRCRGFRSWSMMMNRCTNPNADQWASYGGRGIRVCRRWLKFEAFIADMGEPPADGLTIERNDNDGDYTPRNCRWATKTVQARNRRSTRRVTWRGQTRSLAEWAERLGLPYKALHLRLTRLGHTVERAFTQPFQNHPKRK